MTMQANRQQAVRGVQVFRTGEDGSPLIQSATYGKIYEVTLSEVEQQFIEVEGALGTDKIPETLVIPNFVITFTDFSVPVESLLDKKLHYFVTQFRMPNSDESGDILKPVRLHAYASTPSYGTVRRGQTTNTSLTLVPIEIWFKAANSPANFGNATPTAADTFRLNVRHSIHWANGVDIEKANRVLYGLEEAPAASG